MYEIQKLPAGFTPLTFSDVRGIKKSAYPFDTLAIDTFFVIPAEQKNKFPAVRSSASRYAKAHGIRLYCGLMPNGELRVARLAALKPQNRSDAPETVQAVHRVNPQSATAPAAIVRGKTASEISNEEWNALCMKVMPSHPKFVEWLRNLTCGQAYTFERSVGYAIATLELWTIDIEGITVDTDGESYLTVERSLPDVVK